MSLATAASSHMVPRSIPFVGCIGAHHFHGKLRAKYLWGRPKSCQGSAEPIVLKMREEMSRDMEC